MPSNGSHSASIWSPSLSEAPDLDQLHRATGLTGAALGRTDDNQFLQEI
jgi:hypothetical protein